jgi:murein DD-endopeptidase MepM/ murein hydrolase activator NlpD
VIQGAVNDKVLAVARGQVEEISTNEETGLTMTVDLGDGYEAVYGQLKETAFSQGDIMEAGDILGYVSEPTKYYSLEGPNLYFQLLKDGEPTDPMEYLQ